MTLSRFRHAMIAAFSLASVSLLGSGPAEASKQRPASTSRYAAIVIDATSGAVLHAENAEAQRYPASITKVMTLYMIFDAIDRKRIGFDTRWTVSAFAAGQSPTKLGLEPGRSIAVRDVVLGLITRSANDAAVVAAENLGGSEAAFAQAMTERARRLGMMRTTFRNASGLPHPEQTSTAADLARLARAMIRSFPHHYHFFATTEFQFEGTTFGNHNRFMQWYPGADGLKTGYINASGFNLAASAQRDGQRLIGVVMGGPSGGWRDQRMAQVMDRGFAQRPASRDLPVVRQAALRSPTPAGTATASAPARPPEHRAAALPAPARVRGEIPPHRQGWAVQLGAFADAGRARRVADSARKLAPTYLGGAALEIHEIAGQGRDAGLTRARLGGIAPEAARDACRALKRQKLACVVVPPGAGVARLAQAPRPD
jgi:D-alanyl-D-alanine carboxypeptidase